jgi:hypothetical protein
MKIINKRRWLNAKRILLAVLLLAWFWAIGGTNSDEFTNEPIAWMLVPTMLMLGVDVYRNSK